MCQTHPHVDKHFVTCGIIPMARHMPLVICCLQLRRRQMTPPEYASAHSFWTLPITQSSAAVRFRTLCERTESQTTAQHFGQVPLFFPDPASERVIECVPALTQQTTGLRHLRLCSAVQPRSTLTLILTVVQY